MKTGKTLKGKHMNKTIEALRLADLLDEPDDSLRWADGNNLIPQAAAELRRLTEVVQAAEENALLNSQKLVAAHGRIAELEKAAHQALEFIDANADGADERDIAAALRRALEQPAQQKMNYQQAAQLINEMTAQQEPVAWMWRCKPYCNWPEWSVSLKRPADSGRDGHKRTEGYEDAPLYTHPQAREPLSAEQIAELDCNDHYKFARAVEAAHGIHAPTERGEKK